MTAGGQRGVERLGAGASQKKPLEMEVKPLSEKAVAKSSEAKLFQEDSIRIAAKGLERIVSGTSYAIVSYTPKTNPGGWIETAAYSEHPVTHMKLMK